MKISQAEYDMYKSISKKRYKSKSNDDTWDKTEYDFQKSNFLSYQKWLKRGNKEYYNPRTNYDKLLNE